MGTDKATLGSPPWAHRVAAALEAAGCGTVELQGGEKSLGRGHWTRHDDSRPAAGPARAVVEACGRHPGSTVLVAACDLPALDPAHVSRLVSCCGPGEVRAYRVDGQVNWSLICLGETVASELARWGDRASNASLRALLGEHVVAMDPDDEAVVRDIDRPGEVPGAYRGGRHGPDDSDAGGSG